MSKAFDHVMESLLKGNEMSKEYSSKLEELYSAEREGNRDKWDRIANELDYMEECND